MFFISLGGNSPKKLAQEMLRVTVLILGSNLTNIFWSFEFRMHYHHKNISKIKFVYLVSSKKS